MAFVRYFRSLGLAQGDRIVIRLKSELSISANLAAAHEGIVVASFNQGFSQYSTLGCKLLIADYENLGVEMLPTRVITPQVLLDIGNEKANIKFRGFRTSDELAKIFFTSGTTGSPKAIGLSLAQLTMRVENLKQVLRPAARHFTTIGSDILPGFNTLMICLSLGQTYYVPSNGPNNLALIENQQIDTLLTSPIQLSELVGIAKPEKLSTLNRIQITGSSLSRELFGKIKLATKAQLESQYGSAETGAVALTEVNLATLNKLGKIFPWSEIDVVGYQNQPISAGIVGSVRIRSQAAIHGYLISDTKHDQTFHQGFFYPGDSGQIEADGSISLVGRVSDVINIGGVKVSPAEIEDFIMSRFDVADVAAFSFEDKQGNPRLGIAFVSPIAPDVTELQRTLQARFASGRPNLFLKLPRLPRNEMGKILRHQLAELANKAEKPSI